MESGKLVEAEAAAHTAEHLFIRSLQDLGVDLTVHLVEQDGLRGKVKLKASRLDWKLMVGAMEATNRVIAADVPVTELSFPSVEEAKRAFPRLRAREERLQGDVRVIQIGDYDFATCAHSHARTSGGASLFFVDDFHSLAGSSYEFSFSTGRDAFMEVGVLMLEEVEAARHLHSRHGHVAEAAARAESDVSGLKGVVGDLTSRLFRSLRPSTSIPGIDTYAYDLGPAAGKVLLSEVGRAVASGRNLFVLGYREEGASFVLMASSQGVDVDCREVLSGVLSEQGGKGGGKVNFAMGGGPKVHAEKAIKKMVDVARRKLLENT
jgi:alanyl-tRNA synthetase